MIPEIVLSAALVAGIATREPIQAPAAAATPVQTGKEQPSLEQEFLKNFLRDTDINPPGAAIGRKCGPWPGGA